MEQHITATELADVLPANVKTAPNLFRQNRAARRAQYFKTPRNGHIIADQSKKGTAYHATKGYRKVGEREPDGGQEFLMRFWVNAFDSVDWQASDRRWGWSRASRLAK